MADAYDIIDYLKTLRRGFDKDLFQSKIDELAYIVDNTGLTYDDFHTLFRIWLNISLPAAKWVHLGSCLVPPEIVEERTVLCAIGWILGNYHNQTKSSQVGFLLDWLTVALDCECIDLNVLYSGYDIFYNMLTLDPLSVHAVKLVYTLTKPVNVTRKRVLELLDYAKKREAHKSMYKQLLVLLGLFKSYKPECVPENIPAFPIYTAFKKLNEKLCARFRSVQERRHRVNRGRQHLMWVNPINSEKGRNKKADPLVPNVEFVSLERHEATEPGNNFFDFSEPASLVQHCVHRGMSRVARLRSLLCNETGQALIALHSHSEQARLSHDLHYVLSNCFFEASPYSYEEKQDLLQKLCMLQRTLLQGIPVITTFLAHYLPFWNEKDYFPEILDLTEWVSAEYPENVQQIAECMSAVYLRAEPMQQCAITRALTNMYTNLVFASTKPRQNFLSEANPCNYTVVLPALATAISVMGHKGLQVDPGDTRILFMSMWSALSRTRADTSHGVPIAALPSALTFALPLMGVSPLLIDNVAELTILYEKILSKNKVRNATHMEFISKYLHDILNCLYSEQAFSGRAIGLIFKKMHPELVKKLSSLLPDVDGKYSLRNHLAFAPYTYIKLPNENLKDADNKMVFHSVIEPEFPHLGLLMKSIMPELG